jgi:hypothetical protein
LIKIRQKTKVLANFGRVVFKANAIVVPFVIVVWIIVMVLTIISFRK